MPIDPPALEPILDHYEVKYRERSGNQSIRCPVHDDARASASVNLTKQVWNCHACGNGGTSIDLIMLREGLDYKAALAFGEGISGTSDSPLREGGRTTRRVPDGQGYRPRYYRKVPPGTRPRPDYGS